MLKSGGVVIEITLNKDNGGAFIAGTGSKVAKGTDKVGKLAGSGSFGSHVADKVGIFCFDAFGNCFFKLFAGKIAEFVICKIFEFEFVGSTNETFGMERRNYRVCKFPDFALRIFECAVAVNHNFNVFAGCFKNAFLDVFNKILAVAGEEFYGCFGCFVGTEKAVFFVVTAGNRSGKDIVKTENDFCACFFEEAFGSCAGVDIAGKNAIGIFNDCFGLVCEDDFNFCAFFFNKAAVIINIVNTGEGVFVFAEEFAVFFEGEDVNIRINACFVEFVEAYEFVTDFIGRVGEHKHDFLNALSNTAKADSKSVS